MALPTPKQQVEAAKEALGGVEDEGLRRRIAKFMLEELEKDQRTAAEKMLNMVMRGQSGAPVIEHRRYAEALEPVLDFLRSVLTQVRKVA